MSYNQFSRPMNGYQRSTYSEPYLDGQQSYPQDAYGQQGYAQQPYDSYGYDRQRYSEYDDYNTEPYYGTSGRHRYYPSSYHGTRSRRHGPIIVGSSRTYGRYGSGVSYLPSSRYHVVSSGSRHAPVISGRSYRDDWTSIGTHIRRLFGLGPKQSSGHRGVAVHVTRGVGGTRSSGGSRYYGDKVYAI